MMQKLATVLFCVLGLSSTVVSALSVDCPSPGNIKGVQFTIAPRPDNSSEDESKIIPNQYIAVGEFQAATHTWDVEIGAIQAANEDEAHTNLTKVLDSLNLVRPTAYEPDELPNIYREEGKSTCYFTSQYTNDSRVFVQLPKPEGEVAEYWDKALAPYNTYRIKATSDS